MCKSSTNIHYFPSALIISRKPQSHHHSSTEYESLKNHAQDPSGTRKRVSWEIILGKKLNGGVSSAGKF